MRAYKDNQDFKAFFLLKFTKELITFSYRNEKINDLNDFLEYKENLIKRDIENEVKEKLDNDKRVINENNLPILPGKKKILKKSIGENDLPEKKKILKKKQPLKVPELKTKPVRHRLKLPNLPERLGGIMPIKRENKIDFKKLNPFLNNPYVNSIECDGPGRNLIIRGSRGTKKSDITMNKEEIIKLLKTFSEKSKIPLNNGMNRIAFGSLILSGVYNDNNPAFIISKIRAPSRMRG
ncbi:MAG: hypothetical protein ACOC3Z_00750 [Nanoarchaeota archaeon]